MYHNPPGKTNEQALEFEAARINQEYLLSYNSEIHANMKKDMGANKRQKIASTFMDVKSAIPQE